ncbi:MAG: type II toxin-antitoxin system Phd/YefM family antitoxin [Neisseriaceae bacterium]|nr:type II toxin-antitoxin system Phd/YefM family antitoxin [Neisseriaceae bacterium]
MQQINIFQAKQTFSALIEAVESGQEDEIIIARNNKPVARVIPYQSHKPVILGIAKGKFEIPDDIDKHNDEIAEMFEAL